MLLANQTVTRPQTLAVDLETSGYETHGSDALVKNGRRRTKDSHNTD